METVCHVSLESILHNYHFFQSRIKSGQIIPVVKANAYGHGAVRVTQFLSQEAGVRLFAVATLEEAQELSANLPEISILIFSRVFASELPELPGNAILSVGSMEDARLLAGSDFPDLKVHLNVNTGMNRLGISPDQALELIAAEDQALEIMGIYSHFSSSDTASDTRYLQQKEVFKQFTTELRSRGFEGMIHLSNSAGALHNDLDDYDALRLGIGLYGYDTSPTGRFQAELRPAMEVKAPLVRVERIAAGESVSYAERWLAAIDTNIGTLRIGYADGYSRALTNRAFVSFQDKLYPVVGTVTMDHIMIDLGDDQPPTGNLFTVLGGSSKETKISFIARKLNTIPYEICCAVAPRVKRKYQ